MAEATCRRELDLEIRSQTGGRKSLDEVMRYLYKKFYEAPGATSYGPGRGYSEEDVLDAVNTVSGRDFGDFFAKYVRGTAPLPFDKVLAFVGLSLRTEAAPGSAADLGILSVAEDRGVRIRTVIPGGPADRAGLSRDDLLISLDDQSLATESLADRLAIYPPGATVPFIVERHLLRERVSVTLGPPPRLVHLEKSTQQVGWIKRQKQEFVGPKPEDPAHEARRSLLKQREHCWPGRPFNLAPQAAQHAFFVAVEHHHRHVRGCGGSGGRFRGGTGRRGSSPGPRRTCRTESCAGRRGAHRRHGST